jgi:hypothetical protein
MTTPNTITAFVPEPLDADWGAIRAGLMARLAERIPRQWSDHNPADPGVTLAEVAAFGLADLHYRVAERRLDAWPLEVRAWAADADRHWHATIPPGSLTDIAYALAATATSAIVLEPLIRACGSRADATALLSKPPWAGAFTAAQRDTVIALMRVRLVRQIAQEQADVIGAAVAAQRESSDSPAARDARAAAELSYSLALWPDEISAVARRERHRLSREALVARLDQVRTATGANFAAVRAALHADGLNNDVLDNELDIAMAAAEQPFDMEPEFLEHPTGQSKVWPPHPIQALTCEPVTADDYARRARAHPDVVRAWAVAGRLAGIAWNGLPTGKTPDIEQNVDAKAVTLVVERNRDTGDPDDSFLRAVLKVAIGPEAGAPFPDWRVDLDDLEPRRIICDEIGACALAQPRIVVRATLVCPVGVDRAAVTTDVGNRISTFFEEGRPESRPPEGSSIVDGPWPRKDQPRGGWIPGDPIRFSEVVNAIVGNPVVWGVEGLGMKIEGDPSFLSQSAGIPLDIPRNAVPVLAGTQCLRVRLSLTTECGDA